MFNPPVLVNNRYTYRRIYHDGFAPECFHGSINSFLYAVLRVLNANKPATKLLAYFNRRKLDAGRANHSILINNRRKLHGLPFNIKLHLIGWSQYHAIPFGQGVFCRLKAVRIPEGFNNKILGAQQLCNPFVPRQFV
ncbi:hypothetical protein D3C86_1276140 [compost metagenome]